MATDGRQPTLRGVEKALELIRPFVPETPFVRSEILSRALGCELWLKNEGATATFSFKLRGATNDLIHAKARAGKPLAGAVVSSTGNLGLAVAWVARTLGVPAHVFVSSGVGPAKRAKIELYGGTVHRAGPVYEDARAAAITFAHDNGFHFVDDGDSLDVMEGAGTMALEIARRLPEIDVLIVPMGGGNLTAGSASVMKAAQPAARIVAVQPEAAPVMARSFHERKPLIIPPGKNIADGLTQRESVPFTLEMLWRHLDDAWLVGDRDILAAMHTLLESAHVLAEPSGAASLAAAWTHRSELAGKRVVVVVSGANTTAERLLQALAVPAFVPLSPG